MSRVVVIGAGLAGLVAANRLADTDHEVVLLHQGVGGLQSGQGSIDVFGYSPARVTNPIKAVLGETRRRVPPDGRRHPYRQLGTKTVRESLSYLQKILPELLVGKLEANFQLPTAVGAIRPTCLAQPSMIAGDVVADQRLVIVGFQQLKDFNAELIAQNLNRTELPGGGRVSARALTLEFRARRGAPGGATEGEIDSSGLSYARAFDDPHYRALFAKTLVPKLEDTEVVGFPAVLGLTELNAWAELAELLGHPVFEIPLPPPSIPGIRLDQALTARAISLGVRTVPGARVLDYGGEAGRIVSVRTQPGAGVRDYHGDAFVLATGGFEAGGLALDSFGKISETLFGLPVVGQTQAPFHSDYWADHPLFNCGLAVDDRRRPISPDGEAIYTNLYAAGGILAGSSGWRDKTGDGVTVASAVAAADAIAEELI
jgi:glycerol-3-phosphate dehydrogenase subunit B